MYVDSPAKRVPKGAKYWVQRIGVGIGGAVGSIAIIYACPPVCLVIYLSALSFWGAHEYYRAVRRQGSEPTEAVGIIACILFQFAPLGSKLGWFHEFVPALLAALIIVTLLVELGKPSVHPIPNVGTTVVGALYVGLLLSFFSRMRELDHAQVMMSPTITDAHVGAWLVMFVCAVTWLNDTFGLVTGYMFGRRKLAPTISPAKTWEGAIGGVVAATAFGAAFGSWLQFGLVQSAVLGLLLGIVGLLGDLCESALKRDLGLKDFGTIFANHGGALDRIDSLLFTAPVAYYYIVVFLKPH